MKIIQTLNNGWNLTLVPNATLKHDAFAPQRIDEILNSPYETVPATVPGNFELDLWAAGKIGDPFYSTNMLELQKLENRHLFYTLTFDAPPKSENMPILRFEGIDTVVEILLNGEVVAFHENMFLPIEIPCPSLRETGNELIVHIIPTCIRARDFELTPSCRAAYYNYAGLKIRKASYMYGWDIMPRAVSGGIWKPVYFIERAPEHLQETYLHVTSLDMAKNTAHLKLFYQFHTDEDDIRPMKITVDGQCGDSVFHGEQGIWHTAGHLQFKVENPLLWYPKNAGEPNLYEVEIKLWREDRVVDARSFLFGIRTVELIRTSTIDGDGNGDFHFRVNGKKIFVLGTNWVPLDAYPSQNPKRMPQALALLDDIGVNMVRLWGGNVYEDEEFFDFCDRHGILVWHDFSMACGAFPQDEMFQLQLEEEARAVVRRTRQHTCIALWAGDNECDQAYSWGGQRRDPNFNVLTRKVLADVIRDEDPVRPYLPSSPYIDQVAFDTHGKTSEDHLWGPRDYFKGNYYKNAVCAFASETGYHGCTSPDSLKRFIRPEQLYPITDENGKVHDDWTVKASAMELREGATYTSRINLMTSQLITMFGAVPDTLDRYAKLSQISQAEAKKYFVERFRIGKWKRTGIIWWNLLDGCPQISDAVVDYYFVKKLAYSFIKRSQNPVCMMFDEPQNGAWQLFAANDTPVDALIHYTVTEVESGNTVCAGHVTVPADSTVPVCAVSQAAYPDQHFFRIVWDGDAEGDNHYVTKTRDVDADRYLRDLAACGYDLWEGFSAEN